MNRVRSAVRVIAAGNRGQAAIGSKRHGAVVTQHDPLRIGRRTSNRDRVTGRTTNHHVVTLANVDRVGITDRTVDRLDCRGPVRVHGQRAFITQNDVRTRADRDRVLAVTGNHRVGPIIQRDRVITTLVTVSALDRSERAAGKGRLPVVSQHHVRTAARRDRVGTHAANHRVGTRGQLNRVRSAVRVIAALDGDQLTRR